MAGVANPVTRFANRGRGINWTQQGLASCVAVAPFGCSLTPTVSQNTDVPERLHHRIGYSRIAPREDVRHKTIERVLSDQSADPGDRKFAGQHLLPAPEQTRVECERWRLSPRRLRLYRQTSSATRNRAQLCRRTLHPHLCLLAPPRVRGLRVSPAVPPAGWRPRTAIHRWNSRLAPEPSSAVL